MEESIDITEQARIPPRSIAEVYEHHALERGSKQIRVLDILPAPMGDYDTPIRSALRVVDLEHDTNFAALSYVWGTYAPQRHIILCDDVPFDVTSNCHSALWHLRKKLGGFSIWVDAICINQEDLTEKSHQIPHMGDIYTKATPVYCWLGEGSDDTDRAVKYLSTAGLPDHFRVMADGSTQSRPYAAAWFLEMSWLSANNYPFPRKRGRYRPLSSTNIH